MRLPSCGTVFSSTGTEPEARITAPAASICLRAIGRGVLDLAALPRQQLAVPVQAVTPRT